MSHWESTHGEFEFPEFIFVQMIGESAGEGRARMFLQFRSGRWIKFIVVELDILKEYPCRDSWQELREHIEQRRIDPEELRWFSPRIGLKEIRQYGQRHNFSVFFIFWNPGKVENLKRRQRQSNYKDKKIRKIIQC